MSGPPTRSARRPFPGLTAVLALVFVAAGFDPPQNIIDAVIQHAPNSQFIFAARVDTVNVATMVLPPLSNLEVVTADSIFHYPESYPLQPQQLTVRARNVSTHVTGERRLFFANAWIYGQTLAFREVHSEVIPAGFTDGDYVQLQQLIDSVIADRELSILDSLVDRATHIVSGFVHTINVDSVAVLDPTEHYPDWWEAHILIDDTLKGDFTGPQGPLGPGDMTTISFVTNSRWTFAPRPRPGDEGVFILRDSLPSFIPPHPAVTEPREVHPIFEVGVVDSLVHN